METTTPEKKEKTTRNGYNGSLKPGKMPFDILLKRMPPEFKEVYKKGIEEKSTFLFPILIFWFLTKGKFGGKNIKESSDRNWKTYTYQLPVVIGGRLVLDVPHNDEEHVYRLTFYCEDSALQEKALIKLQSHPDWPHCDIHFFPKKEFAILELRDLGNKKGFYVMLEMLQLLAELDGNKEMLIYRPIDDSGPSVSYGEEKK